MAFTLDAPPRMAALPFDAVIDVRAPAEFAEDHLPGAINLPVLSDAERARVGTIYVREDRFRARVVGAALVARNAADHIDRALADKPGGWKPLIYCWRGGQRSGSFAAILSQIGWRVAVLDGGYRAYRRQISAMLYDAPLGLRPVLIDGGTGTAKTRLLHGLAARGAQVIDLEALANHRGSNFGARPGGQPTQKMFESRLAATLLDLDPDRTTYLEAESTAIGRILLPPSIWAAMRAAPTIRVSAPMAARGRHLTTAYPDLTQDGDALAARIDAMRPYQPRDRIEAWHALAADGRHATLAEGLIEHHYDPAYSRSRPPRPVALSLDLPDLGTPELDAAVDRILAAAGR